MFEKYISLDFKLPFYNFIGKAQLKSKMSGLTKKQSSPLRRQGSMSSFDNSSLAFGESRNRNKQQIDALIHKFNEINQQVVLDGDQAHFNLISYERENEKIKYDPQMMAAKLRKLENRAQINRAQREIDNREKKKLKRLSLHKEKEIGKTYKTIYEEFLKDNRLTNQFEDFSDDQSTQNKTKPKGVSFFRELKRHPLLLQYTLHKINEKEKEDEDRVKKLQNTLTRMRKQNSDISGEYKQLLDDFNKKLLQSNQQNPETIIETRFSKFYSKKSSDKLSKQVKSIPRCSKMIEKQNQIVSQLKQNSLSKQNKLKLKSRLNQIISSISKTEKFASVTLPKLQALNHMENQKQL